MKTDFHHPSEPGTPWRALGLPLLAAFLGLTGCGSADNATVLRLVDLFTEELVRNTPTKIARAEETDLWNFAETSAAPDALPTLGWKAGTGVSDFGIRDGRLKGRTTTETPIIYLERTAGLDSVDVLHAIEVRVRASEGENLMATVQGDQPTKGAETDRE